MELSDSAKKVRDLYMKEYRIKNKERILELHTKWRKNNPDKIKGAQNRYWEWKAKELKGVL